MRGLAIDIQTHVGIELTVFVIPGTACLAAVYAPVPCIVINEFTLAQFTIEPRCSTRPASLDSQWI